MIVLFLSLLCSSSLDNIDASVTTWYIDEYSLMCLAAKNQLLCVIPQPSNLCLKGVLVILLLLLRNALVFAFLHEKRLSDLEEAN